MKIQRLSWAGLKIKCGDSYILIGKFNPPAPAGDWEWSTQSIDLTLTDRTGQEILYSYSDDIFPSYSQIGTSVTDPYPYIDMDPPLLPFEPNPGVWAVKVSKGFAAPLTIHYAMSYILGDPQTTYTFEFDAGPNPQPGKTWELN